MFIGREYYLERLEALWRKSVASLVVISGRRRIGKSTLVEVFAKSSKCGFIEIEGLAPDKYMTNEKQIENFCASLARTTGSPEVRADSWPKAVSESDQDLCYMHLTGSDECDPSISGSDQGGCKSDSDDCSFFGLADACTWGLNKDIAE